MTYEYDVIVVGFGAAGAAAAIEAADAGGRVLVVDRRYGGGATALSGGIVYAGGATRYQQMAELDDDACSSPRYDGHLVRLRGSHDRSPSQPRVEATVHELTGAGQPSGRPHSRAALAVLRSTGRTGEVRPTALSCRFWEAAPAAQSGYFRGRAADD